MTIININDKLHNKIKELVKRCNSIEYPSVKNFVDRTLKEKLDEIEAENSKSTKKSK